MLNEILHEFNDPYNYIVIIFTVLTFAILLLSFFVLVFSKFAEVTVSKKLDYLVILYNTNFYYIKKFLSTKPDYITEVINDNIKDNNESSYINFSNKFYHVYLSVIFFLLYIFLTLIYFYGLSRDYMFILSFVFFFTFLPEIYIYYVIIYDYIIVSDQHVFLNLHKDILNSLT